jgi:hypothetical protein
VWCFNGKFDLLSAAPHPPRRAHRAHVHTDTHTRIHAYVHMRARVNIHTHTHTHTLTTFALSCQLQVDPDTKALIPIVKREGTRVRNYPILPVSSCSAYSHKRHIRTGAHTHTHTHIHAHTHTHTHSHTHTSILTFWRCLLCYLTIRRSSRLYPGRALIIFRTEQFTARLITTFSLNTSAGAEGAHPPPLPPPPRLPGLDGIWSFRQSSSRSQCFTTRMPSWKSLQRFARPTSKTRLRCVRVREGEVGGGGGYTCACASVLHCHTQPFFEINLFFLGAHHNTVH